jgi:hypothetical protein
MCRRKAAAHRTHLLNRLKDIGNSRDNFFGINLNLSTKRAIIDVAIFHPNGGMTILKDYIIM